MHRFSDVAAVIFDMDGLLLDTETTYCAAWQRAAKTMGHFLSDDFFKSLSGMHYHDIQQKLLQACGANFDLHAFHTKGGVLWREKVYEEGIPIKHGALELLDYLKVQQIPYGLATNSLRVNTLECLKLAELHDYFSIIITRDDVAQGKPAPDVFLKAATILGVPVDKCLILEDSVTGIEAATLSGALAVYIPSTDTIDPSTSQKCAFMFNDLFEVLLALNNHR